jgi:hypothetical protein
VRPAPGCPPPVGAHELAWGLLLDRVFADAFHAGLATLWLTLPRPELEEPARWRGEWTPAPPGARGTGVAVLAGPAGPPPQGTARLYLLEAGPPAPAALRRALPRQVPPRGWRLQGRWGVYGWGPRLGGVPVRLGALARRPHWADRAMRAVRAGFEHPGLEAGTYRLTVWTPP